MNSPLINCGLCGETDVSFLSSEGNTYICAKCQGNLWGDTLGICCVCDYEIDNGEISITMDSEKGKYICIDCLRMLKKIIYKKIQR